MNAETEFPKPILTAHLFPKLEKMLVDLLCSLGSADWERQTVAPKWKVKDVAAHLLDTQLRRLSTCRDAHNSEPADIRSQQDLVAYINRLNEEGVRIYRRLSPRVLITLMEMASRQTCEYFESLDPFAPAQFSVSWAGESSSANWFDTAREFTERWHHQQQIRLAAGKLGITTREFYYPVLDCFMRALPFHYRTISGWPGVLARFNISGECGGSWYLFRSADGWELLQSLAGEVVSETTIPQEIAWRIFTKGIDLEAARSQVQVSGDLRLGLHILRMISIIG
jgi:uncharacterized protein (TIGR03083 family)